MPLCITPYDVDRLNLLGGSKKFLLQFNKFFQQLFSTSPHIASEPKSASPSLPASTKAVVSDAFPYENWIPSRPNVMPEIVQKAFRDESFVSCLLKPQEADIRADCQGALTSIIEYDPENYIEYALNYQMYNYTSDWPPKMFHKARSGCKKFFYRSQLPLSWLCWAHEILMIMGVGAEDSVNNEEEEDADVIRKISLGSNVISQNDHRLLMCLDFASTTKNAPPTWVYVVKEKFTFFNK